MRPNESIRVCQRLIILSELANEQKVTYSPEVRERAVRMVLTSEHEHSSRWAAVVSISSKIGYTPETLRAWVNKIEVDTGNLRCPRTSIVGTG